MLFIHGIQTIFSCLSFNIPSVYPRSNFDIYAVFTVIHSYPFRMFMFVLTYIHGSCPCVSFKIHAIHPWYPCRLSYLSIALSLFDFFLNSLLLEIQFQVYFQFNRTLYWLRLITLKNCLKMLSNLNLNVV